MIRLENVTAGYMDINIIKNISLTFEKGKIISVIGKNGCGKTTLLKTAARIIEPYSGDILLNEESILNMTNKETAKVISYLPQNRDIPNIKVYDLVMHGRFPYLGFPRIPTNEDKIKVEEALHILEIEKYKSKNIRELSGGERQKVYIAMVLAQDTEIVFLDEPTTYLDINHQLEILEVVKNLKKMGKTVVMVIHDLNSALTYSDMVCLMDRGEVVVYDKPQVVYESGKIERIFNIKCHEVCVPFHNSKYFLLTLK
ncbi:MAG TPA: ABC transporter ATP-binding protein [Tissierellia bacterium]|nr:ABC transporter ATP-binding protein [Tissierellia bacterium]